jgi:hypothetical protein
MGGNVGIATGPLATAILLLAFNWRIVTVLLAVPALLATVCGLSFSFDPTAAVDLDGEADRSPPATLAEFTSETRRLFTLGFLIVFVIVALNGLYYRGILTFLPNLLGDFLATSVGDVTPGFFGPDSPFAEEFDMSRYLYVGLLTVGIAGYYLGGRLSDAVEPDRGPVFVLVGLTGLALAFVPVAGMGLGGLLVASFVL